MKGGGSPHFLFQSARGFHPWPGAYTSHEWRLLNLLRVSEVPGDSRAEAGHVVELSAKGILVACGPGSLLLLEEVQPESRKAMRALSWAQGARLRLGARLG